MKIQIENKQSVIDELINYIKNDAEIAIPISEFFKEEDGLKRHLTKKEYGKVVLKYLVKELKEKNFKENHKKEIINTINECRNAYRSMSAKEYYEYKFNQIPK